jgi:hypothetical protein
MAVRVLAAVVASLASGGPAAVRDAAVRYEQLVWAGSPRACTLMTPSAARVFAATASQLTRRQIRDCPRAVAAMASLNQRSFGSKKAYDAAGIATVDAIRKGHVTVRGSEAKLVYTTRSKSFSATSELHFLLVRGRWLVGS